MGSWCELSRFVGSLKRRDSSTGGTPVSRCSVIERHVTFWIRDGTRGAMMESRNIFRSRGWIVVVAGVIALCFGAMAADAPVNSAPATPLPATGPGSFLREVAPILADRRVKCHWAEKLKSQVLQVRF